ncbi:ABC transporter related protein (plasmid) [Gemmatirosa kalamazoonensis]|uniref:ABC transporter related protein n=1 Tax=Gemmatirosa kalamazoonensis TaxID=861299 RepID=W0RRC4_9BACT|nr:ABC transporter ATP-binding protein [Gemmatirosa kalamazoonensis]AHG93017.1 ABC transporter related protein [Gemmatirosa kalamazoonensis]
MSTDLHTQDPAIAVEDLTRRYGAFTAVDAVSFAVARGEVFGFLGPNGAGKTTTIKMLTGLVRPTSGRGTVAGLDVTRDGARIKHVIGYMSQLFSLYHDLTVDENIEFAGGLHGVTGARLAARRDWVLAMAGLEAERRRPTGELPLGWKQRLALGCAVLHEPRVLFLDEPTSGVDPLARRAFWDVIRELAAAGTTVLVSTHYMEEAEYCGRLALMNRGRLVALGTPAGLRDAMPEPVLRVAVSDAPRAVAALAGAEGVLEASLFGRVLRVVAADAVSATRAIRTRLEGAGIVCHGVERVPSSLEDVFVSRVRSAGGAVIS